MVTHVGCLWASILDIGFKSIDQKARGQGTLTKLQSDAHGCPPGQTLDVPQVSAE